jgi:hypothetical protein
MPLGRYQTAMSIDVYEVRPHKVYRGVNLISHALPFGRLWYAEPVVVSNATGCAKFYSRSHRAVIRIYDFHRCVDSAAVRVPKRRRS